MQIPEYRVRVFLSVDLSGSTAYKATLKSSLWIRTFKKFYTYFLKNFRSKYIAFCESNVECKDFADKLPKLWKTVGDEAIFVNRIENLFHLFAYVHAFDQTLSEYSDLLAASEQTDSLNVKGNGWLASFPYPNQTIHMGDADKLDFEDSLPEEKHESGADREPGEYEFLGPGIDSGFRISTNSTPAFFTLSPALACVLCRANTNRDFSNYSFKLEYHGVTKLKGVISGENYPVVGINTERDANRAQLIEQQKTLDGTAANDPKELIDYLENFIKFHDIEMPPLGINGSDTPITPPDFYVEKFVPEWNELAEELSARDLNLAESAETPDEEPTENTIDQQTNLTSLMEALEKLFTEGKN